MPPDRNGVAIAAEFGGDLEVGGTIEIGGPQDQSTPKDQGLRGGAGANQRFELSSLKVCQCDSFREWERHR